MIVALYSVFLITSIYTAALSLHKSTGTGTNLLTSNLSTLFFKLFKPVGTFSNLSATDFKLAKSTFSANFDISKIYKKSTFLA